MELTLVGLQFSGKTTFVNVIAVSMERRREQRLAADARCLGGCVICMCIPERWSGVRDRRGEGVGRRDDYFALSKMRVMRIRILLPGLISLSLGTRQKQQIYYVGMSQQGDANRFFPTQISLHHLWIFGHPLD